MADPDFEKTVFVIMPFGEEGTKEREQNNDTFDNIIKKAVEEAELGLTCIRADEITRSGSIIDDVIRYAARSQFVIADLSNENPNVFYELGIRHSFSDRTILMAQSPNDLPFDVMPQRTIMYSKATLTKGTQAKNKLVIFLREMSDSINLNPSPVKSALGTTREHDSIAVATGADDFAGVQRKKPSGRSVENPLLKKLALQLEMQGYHRVDSTRLPKAFVYWVMGGHGNAQVRTKKINAVYCASDQRNDLEDFRIEAMRVFAHARQWREPSDLRFYFVIDSVVSDRERTLADLYALSVKSLQAVSLADIGTDPPSGDSLVRREPTIQFEVFDRSDVGRF